MAESGNDTNIFLRFSEKLNRFNRAAEGERNFLASDTSDAGIKRKIQESEEERRSRIAADYTALRFSASKSVEEEREGVYRCYCLYKSVLELNETSGDARNCIRAVEFDASVLHAKSCFGGRKFINIQAWLYFEKGVCDFVPVLTENPSGKTRLDFVDFERHRFSAEEREVLEEIRLNFYA